ncbi:hypothetical protein L3Q82_019611, partial [Scortum barcoo]
MTDTFTFSVAATNKPFTRRGVLSSVNSVFDPLGLLAPTIQEGALLRELTSEQLEWDTPLPEDKQSKWETWRDSLKDLKELHVPRTYTSTSLSQARCKELHLFSDASTKAIGAVAYLKAVQPDDKVEVGFIMGKARLAPQSEPTIPRLELCAAILAVEMADLIQDELDLQLDAVHFYTDSTNFIGASKELGMDRTMQQYLKDQGCSWEFNPPHASHMGGSWERMIGIARRILDSMLLQNK